MSSIAADSVLDLRDPEITGSLTEKLPSACVTSILISSPLLVKYALVFGNEVDGVGQEAVDMCDGAVEIPQAGTKHSINVSVAGGVVLWDIFSQLRAGF